MIIMHNTQSANSLQLQLKVLLAKAKAKIMIMTQYILLLLGTSICSTTARVTNYKSRIVVATYYHNA